VAYEDAVRVATSPHDFKLMVAAGGTHEPPMQAGLAPAPSAPPPGVPA
jgi:hypothetical protein